MEDLRIVLIIVGALAIGALLMHGLWSIRKQSQARLSERKMQKTAATTDSPEGGVTANDANGFDSDGIGKVRIISGSSPDKAHDEHQDKREPVISVHIDDDPETGRKEPSLKPTMQQADMFGKNEPVLSRTTADVPVQEATEDTEDKAEQTVNEAPEEVEPQLVLVLNVQSHANDSLSGAAMLPALLTLGFKYGEMSIFHRHEDSAGIGEVLFSLANMVKPGTFDPENMETFTTPGVSLFLALPGKGESQKIFNMMLNAAEQLAGVLGGQVTDEQRNVLTKQKIRHYQERIREFERKRLVTH